VISEQVQEGSILVTDGYPSYPQAAASLGMTHIIVNHSVGFTTESGDNTNSIENIWSHLKSELRMRHGVLRSEMENFVKEFCFRKYFLVENKVENINVVFMDLLKFIFGSD
jgi:hypothetical protein